MTRLLSLPNIFQIVVLISLPRRLPLSGGRERLFGGGGESYDSDRCRLRGATAEPAGFEPDGAMCPLRGGFVVPLAGAGAFLKEGNLSCGLPTKRMEMLEPLAAVTGCLEIEDV